MAPKPTVEIVATAKLIFDLFMEENNGKSMKSVNESLTGYPIEIIAMVQAMMIEWCFTHGECHSSMLAHLFASGAWLARKHSEHVLAHLAGLKRPNGQVS